MKKSRQNCFREFFMAICIALFITGCIVSCKKDNPLVIMDGHTKMFSDPECSFYHDAKNFIVLEKGGKGKLIGFKYMKDCMVYKVKLTDGRVGYITLGDDFRVIERQKK